MPTIAPKTFRSLEIEQIERVASQLKTRQLPLSVYRALEFDLEITHTNGSSPSVTLFDLASCISKINIVLNGQDTIISIPFWFLVYHNLFTFSHNPYYSLFTSASSQGTSYLHVVLPFALLRAVAPADTLLDARNLSSAVVEVQWAANPLSGVTSIDSGYLGIQSQEYTRVPDNAKFARHEFGWDSVNLDKTGTIQVKLETQANNQYRRLWIFTFNSSGDLADSQIDNIILRERSFTYHDIAADRLRARNMAQFAIDSQAGVFCLDLVTDRMMSERVDARNLTELILEVNSLVTNGTMEVIKEKAIYA